MASIKTTNINDILIIKKNAQIHGRILTNHSDHQCCPYPKLTNPNYILSIGSKLKVIFKGKRETKWSQSYVTVKDSKGNKFDILSKDLLKFCE